MTDFLLTYYLWIKALHVIAVMAWMAGLLYLPRLYVYHALETVGSATSETFKIMERRLLRFIMNPAMIITWVIGLLMLWLDPFLLKQGWMHAKLTLVVLMSAAHMAMAKWRKAFERDDNQKSDKFFRIANEIPTVLMIAIVLLAVAKPF